MKRFLSKTVKSGPITLGSILIQMIQSLSIILGILLMVQVLFGNWSNPYGCPDGNPIGAKMLFSFISFMLIFPTKWAAQKALFYLLLFMLLLFLLFIVMLNITGYAELYFFIILYLFWGLNFWAFWKISHKHC